MLCFAKNTQFGHIMYKLTMFVLHKSAYCSALSHFNSVMVVYAAFVSP